MGEGSTGTADNFKPEMEKGYPLAKEGSLRCTFLPISPELPVSRTDTELNTGLNSGYVSQAGLPTAGHMQHDSAIESLVPEKHQIDQSDQAQQRGILPSADSTAVDTITDEPMAQTLDSIWLHDGDAHMQTAWFQV